MKCRAVSGVILGLTLMGCAQGRSAQAPPGYAGTASLPPIQATINAGLGPEAARAVAASPPANPPATAGEAVAGRPIRIEPLDPIQATINAGLAPRDGSAGGAMTASAAPAAVPSHPVGAPPSVGPVERSPLILPPVEPSVAASTPVAEPPPLVAPPIGSGSEPARPAATVDQTVQAASSESTSIRSADLGPGRVVGLSVATVDGEHITLAELIAGVEDYKQTFLPEGQTLSNAERDQLAGIILQQLVDRTLLIQEAKRRLLTTEQKEKMFYDHADTQWREQEIPKLCRKNNVSNEFALREALEKRGRSLDMMHETFRKSTLAREFLQMQLQSQISSPGTPQHLTAYYRSHLNEFHLPAQVTWREIVVNSDPAGGRAEARKRADALLDQLRRGADFAALATAESAGPTAARGGYWATEPGASIAPAVNEALERLPIGQISSILEGPNGYHIVRVEDRHAAGPKPFPEVQREIFAKLQEKAFGDAAEKYILRLRERALVTSRFEGTASAPAAMRDASARRASATGP